MTARENMEPHGTCHALLYRGERLYACMMTALRPHGRDFPDFVEDVPAELAVMSLSFSAAKKKVPQRKSRHCVELEALSS